jgi:hypothetical protein
VIPEERIKSMNESINELAKEVKDIRTRKANRLCKTNNC